jgi:hypothetical protein
MPEINSKHVVPVHAAMTARMCTDSELGGPLPGWNLDDLYPWSTNPPNSLPTFPQARAQAAQDFETRWKGKSRSGGERNRR